MKKKKKENLNKHQKLMKSIYIITLVVIVLLTIGFGIKSSVDYAKDNLKNSQNFLVLISKEYDENALLSNTNKITSSDYDTLNSKLKTAGVTILNELEINKDATPSEWRAESSVELTDSEFGYLLNLYLKYSNSENYDVVSVKELTLTQTDNLKRFSMKSVFSINTEKLLNNLSLNSEKTSGTIQNITVTAISEVGILNGKLAIFNGTKIKVNNLSDEESKSVVNQINNLLDSDSSFNINIITQKIVSDFASTFSGKTNTSLKLKTHKFSFILG